MFTPCFTGVNLSVVSLTIVNTLLAPVSALCTIRLLSWYEHGFPMDDHPLNVLNSSTAAGKETGFNMDAVLAGLAAIAAGCNIVQPWAALVIGAVAAVVYKRGSIFLVGRQIDDAVNAGPIHLCCGIW